MTVTINNSLYSFINGLSGVVAHDDGGPLIEVVVGEFGRFVVARDEVAL